MYMYTHLQTVVTLDRCVASWSLFMFLKLERCQCLSILWVIMRVSSHIHPFRCGACNRFEPPTVTHLAQAD